MFHESLAFYVSNYTCKRILLPSEYGGTDYTKDEIVGGKLRFIGNWGSKFRN